MVNVRGVGGRPVFVGVLVAFVVVVGAGLYWFQPWKLWQDETVREALPEVTGTSTAVAGTPAPEPGASTPVAGTATPEAVPSRTTASASAEPASPQTLARGGLISHEHATSGGVRLLRLADGSHVLRLENLDTSNGPDLRVWLTDAPVRQGQAGWHVFDDGEYVSLGRLKGNKGDQNYRLPAGVDPAAFTSVSIWCDRFNVSFGAAELARV
ncbi:MULTISPECIES: DM13 domain-containing protein [Streptomyces]|uniref:Electron transporter n=1 Tax=Streptomyces dengpaensis TaxID=2049881 RepID=A0ABM6SSC3_9ACTN|nr:MULTISPECIES: DM13 domain-containing protein [Streptomyces]AVH57548.1 electron transporter [Streptomyces dengpaensis]PIB02705.1 electron transporter [Streptomyces sp. HG99]